MKNCHCNNGHSGRTSHVELHLLDHRPRPRLDVVTTRVEGEPLADVADLLGRLVRVRVRVSVRVRVRVSVRVRVRVRD